MDSDLVRLAPEDKAALKAKIVADPWLFSLYVCRKTQDNSGVSGYVERFHRPLLYVYTRKAALLAACLADSQFDSWITDSIRADFRSLGIDWTKPADLPRIQHRLRKVNVRLPRGFAKSTLADDADLYDITLDPDLTTSLGMKNDEAVFERIEKIGRMVQAEEYAFWFPERIPSDDRVDITKSRINLGGRQNQTTEPSYEGRGITSSWARTHYRKHRRDDIVGTEQGDASIADALNHMAHMDGVSVPDRFGGSVELHIGTIHGVGDDHSVLYSDQAYLSIVMPVEIHRDAESGERVPTTLENVYDDGELVAPEWYNRERINEIKLKAKTNPREGPVALLENFYMSAGDAGALTFTRRLLDQATFEIFEDAHGNPIIGRPKIQMRDLQRETLGYDDWVFVDLRKLPRNAFAWACDQSVSASESADIWAMSLVVLDWEGAFYVINMATGRGYDTMRPRLLLFDEECGSPPRNGMDTAAAQRVTLNWMRESPKYQDIVRRIEGTASQTDKELLIRNEIVAPMKTGHLWIPPRGYPEGGESWVEDFRSEMLYWRPITKTGTKNKRAHDNRMDSVLMAKTYPRLPPSPEQLRLSSRQALIAAFREHLAEKPPAGATINLGEWSENLWKGHAA